MSDLSDLVTLAKAVDLVALIGQAVSLKRVTTREFAGACVRCGGKDRLRVNLDRGWFCRVCQGSPDSGGHWHDAIDWIQFRDGVDFKTAVERATGRRSISPEEAARLEAERQARLSELERAEAQKTANARRELNERAEWREYHANLNQQRRELWRARGVPDDWQDYHNLGYCPPREWAVGEGKIISDSLTIPYFRPVVKPRPGEGDEISFEVIDLKHRLIDTNAPGGKYRHHIAGCGNNLYIPDMFVHPDRLSGDLLVVEGEIKAMVTNLTLWDGDVCMVPDLTVIGVPGKNWKPEWVQQFSRAARVFVCLDPDAHKDSARLAQSIGDHARSVLLPEKIDDLITAGVLDWERLTELLGYTWRG